MTQPVHLLVSDDASLLAQAREKTLNDVLGADRSILVQYKKGMSLEELLLARSLFSPRTVLDISSPSASDVALLIEYLAAPDPDVCLVISSAKASVKLANAAKKAGGAVTTIGTRGSDAAVALIEGSKLSLSPAAKKLLIAHAGSDFGGLIGTLRLLEAMYGPHDRVDAAELEGYLGRAGSVPPWVICDAIDARDPGLALSTLSRQLTSVPAIAVIASIRAHIQRLFYAQALGSCSVEQLAALTNHGGPPFPLTKAIRSARSWGDAAWAIELVAAAEHDLRGGSAVPAEMVMQILVCRLAKR